MEPKILKEIIETLRQLVGHADAIKLLRRPLTLDELNHLGRAELRARLLIDYLEANKEAA